VRFPAPVAVGSRVRARATMRAVEKLPGDAVQIIMRTTVEIEGLDKPACVADTVSRYYF
jgi:acyl dehydratase